MTGRERPATSMGKLQSEKDQNIIIFLCWLIYTAAYVGRYSFSANIPQIEEQFCVGHSATGLISMCFFISYGVGQVVNGIFCKKYPKRIVLSGVLVLSALVNLILWIGVDFAAYKYLWLVNGLVQSVMYSSLMIVIGNFVQQRNYKKAVLVMGTTVGIGTLCAYGMSSLLQSLNRYRYIFLFSAAVMSVSALVWFFLYGRIAKRLEGERNEIAAQDGMLRETNKKSAVKGVIVTIAVFGIFAIINNLIKDGLLSWVPSVMIEMFSLPGEISTLLTVILPAVAVFGTALMLFCNKLCKNNYYLSAGILFLLTAALCFAVTVIMPYQSLWVVAMVCLAVVNCFMSGINNLVTTVIPLSLRQNVSAGLSAGLFDGFCYIGSAISTYGLGAVAEGTGWTTVFYLFAAAACIPVLFAFVAIPVTVVRRRKGKSVACGKEIQNQEMKKMKTNEETKRNEYAAFERIGAEKARSYYVPFSEGQEAPYKNGILEREASDRFLVLDGEWNIKKHASLDEVEIDEELFDKIAVPSCVQIKGFDTIQYLNARYPFPFDPPHVPSENPAYHYRRSFTLGEIDEKYYLVFEGVDSAFYVFVNGKEVGYGQISHAMNEFDITPFVKAGENVLDVVVLKWCAGTYLECQDKFRFTGIFRSVYVLSRPKEHISDFKIESDYDGKDGFITVHNFSEIPFHYSVNGEEGELAPQAKTTVTIKNAIPWTAEQPHLYEVILSASGEKILQKVGVRRVCIENGIFKINGKHIKLKGVNRHEMSPETGATVTAEDTLKDLELMKWANVNAIRTCHYPDMPEFYELCDALGFYVIDEADVETHGVGAAQNGYDVRLWEKFTDNGTFDRGVLDREVNLYERDKNKTCVIIWSLGNESNYGKMFYEGADYIHARDSRPIHYEGIVYADRSKYYTDRIDIASRMYAPPEFFDEFLQDEKETRPYVLCEYSHAMGNSNGDLNDYWNKIDSNDRFMGAFVWEWGDHAVKGEKGFLYGGDFGETEHDGNFCVDGLVAPDRKVKSNLLELKAVYGGKREKKFVPPAVKPFEKVTRQNPVKFVADKRGRIEQIGDMKFCEPMHVQILRAYLDNDKVAKEEWARFEGFAQEIYDVKALPNGGAEYYGKIVKNTYAPVMSFTLSIEPFDGGADISLSYEVAEYISYLPRIGLEFAFEKANLPFEYDGYGEAESYIDKHMASEYGTYRSTAEENYGRYIKPQESGSHFCATRLNIGGMEITAEQPFSFNVCPYSTETLMYTAHDFELPESDKTHLNLDIAMSGVGTNSCGPALAHKYRAPKIGRNTFRVMACRGKQT